MAKVVVAWILFAFFLHSALWTLVDMKEICSNETGWDKTAPCYPVQDIPSNAVLCMFRVNTTVSKCCKFRRHTNTEQEKASPDISKALDTARYCLNVLNNDRTNDASCYFESLLTIASAKPEEQREMVQEKEYNIRCCIPLCPVHYLLNESKDEDLYNFVLEKMEEREKRNDGTLHTNSKIDAKIKTKLESIPSHVNCKNVDEMLTTSTETNALGQAKEQAKKSPTDAPRASEPSVDSPPQQNSLSWHMIVILVLQTGFTLFLAYYLILVVLPDSEYVYPEKKKFGESRRAGSSNA